MNPGIAVSVVLVNYKVYRYLHLALQSLEQSIVYFDRCLAGEAETGEGWMPEDLRLDQDGSVNVEVWVVDNASDDGSEELIRASFPWVHWIQNTENVGFARANNQALRQAQGRYLLIQNPDTVLSELTLWKCWQAMESDPAVGALGVRMLDGQGRFLRESKRGLPTPEAAFFKLTGLAAIFPRHPRLGAYHAGHLDPESDHDVAILAGAFMWVRAQVAQEIGLLDERYFMYGEDIDWSYRILLAGYRNRYLGTNPIIHFKGESTQKESMRYVRMFYGAMMEFADRYYGTSRSFWLHIMLRIGIAGRATLSVLRRWSTWVFHPVLDWLGFMGLMKILTRFWENHIKVNTELGYPAEFTQYVIPIYVSIWVLSGWLNGVYETPYRYHRVIRGMALGTLAIGFVYAFLPSEWRFSRGLILAGASGCLLLSLSIKGIVKLILYGNLTEEDRNGRGLVLGVGSGQGIRLAANLYMGIESTRWIGHVADGLPNLLADDQALGQSGNLSAIVSSFEPEELVLDSRQISFERIIEITTSLHGMVKNFKYLPKDMEALIGSGDIILPSNHQDSILVDYSGYDFRRSQRWTNLVMGIALFVMQLLLYFRLKPIYREFSIPWRLWGGRLDWFGSKKLNSKPFLFDLDAIACAKSIQSERARNVWIKFLVSGKLHKTPLYYAIHHSSNMMN